jgi:hypothetical protein
MVNSIPIVIIVIGVVLVLIALYAYLNNSEGIY